MRSLFRKVGVGGRVYIPEICRLGSRYSWLGPPLKLAAMRLVSGDLLVVATNTDPKSALAHYRRRWEIETLFAATKTRGFNSERRFRTVIATSSLKVLRRPLEPGLWAPP